MNNSKIEFVDIYDVWYQPWWKSGWWYLFCIFTACIICVSVLYYLYLRGWFIKKLSCDQQALKKLNYLASAPYDRPEQLYAAYFQLTLISKIYFSQKFNVILVDKTDHEILPMVQKFMNSAEQSLMEEFLERSFQIKFAREATSQEMLQDDIKFIKKIVIQTTKDFDKVGRS